MSDERPISTRRDLEARIIAKAWKDPDYMARLKKDPKGVLADELTSVDSSIELPSKLTVKVHEEDATTFHLVVPRNPHDLSVADVVGGDLEAVAPQTIAVVVAALGAVVGNTAGAVNNVGAGNVVAAGNVATTGNAVANSNTVA